MEKKIINLILLLNFVFCCNAQNTRNKDTIVKDILYGELKGAVKIGDVNATAYYLSSMEKDSLFYDKTYSRNNSLLIQAFKNRDSQVLDVLLKELLGKKEDSSLSKKVKGELTNYLKVAIDEGDLLMVETLVKHGANAFDVILLTINNGRIQNSINRTLLKNLIKNESIGLNKTEMVTFFIKQLKISKSLTKQSKVNMTLLKRYR